MKDKSQLLSIFADALECTSAENRAAYLNQACGDDGELRARVEDLLQAHHHAPNFLEGQPAQDDAAGTANHAISERPGSLIGSYKLLEQIGEGGFGVVFMAQQTEPVKRRVALKIIKPGMDTGQVVARFEAERQALALMDHPQIAHVLDAGATDTGRPYFVMELVKGIPITEYCDQCSLTTEERLELFTGLCRGVQHAHQKGIIHRDIKPTNVLVAIQDGKPTVKIIDFGIAKAIHHKLLGHTLLTGFHQMLGTPLYMSPEQAEMSALDVDTRADIYSLGVLLYELLTGTTPLQKESLGELSFEELRRKIREEEPPKPSDRLSTLADRLSTIAVHRRTEPRQLIRTVRGELDWIVMRCLEKDRNRRYETADALMLDVQRYLNDEPVQACPPSVGYRLQKFTRRHRGAVFTTALVFFVLVVGIFATSWQTVRATRAEGEAWESATKERKAKQDERQAKEVALKTLAQINKANEILRSVYHDLNPRTPSTGVGGRLEHLSARLDWAAKQAENEAIGDAVIVARLQNTLGAAQTELGFPRKALTLLLKARKAFVKKLGDDHPETLTCTNDLARAYRATGDMHEALPLFKQTLAKRRTKLGPNHPETLVSMNNLAHAYKMTDDLKRAFPLFKETLDKRLAVHGPNHPNTLVTMAGLASVLKLRGEPDKALPIYEEAAQKWQALYGLTHPDTLVSRNNLASCYRAVGKLKKSLDLYEDTLKRRRERLGANHPDTLLSMYNLASVCQEDKQHKKAVSLLEEAVAKQQAVLGDDHPHTLRSMHQLASAYHALRQLDKSIALYEQTLAKRTKHLKPNHAETLGTMHGLALVYWDNNKLEKALPLFQKTFKMRRETLGPYHVNTVDTMSCLGRVYQLTEALDKALPLLKEVLAITEAKHDADADATLIAAGNVAVLYLQLGQCDAAEPLLVRVLQGRQRKLGPKHPIIGRIKAMQETLRQVKPTADAYQAARQAKGDKDVDTLSARMNFAGALVRRNQLTAAIFHVRAIHEARSRLVGDEHPDAFTCQLLIGSLRLAQKRYAEAETSLLEGYAQLKKHPDAVKDGTKIHARGIAAIRQIVRLYEAWGKKEQAKQWQAKLAKVK